MSTMRPNAGNQPRSSPVALSATTVRDWYASARAELLRLRAEINDLNVFPIPDSDTGSNLVHTIAAASDAVIATASDDATQLLQIAADSAVAQARGNSGIIMAQILRGLADAATAVDEPTFTDLWVDGLSRATLGARAAVSEPRDGTMLSLVRECARCAEQHQDANAGDLARAVADVCVDGLNDTTRELPELTAAGVVDAGGRGLLAILDAMVTVLTGVHTTRQRYRGALSGGGDRTGHDALGVDSGGESASDDTDFEVMYRFTTPHPRDAIAALRSDLDAVGTAVVIVGESASVGGRSPAEDVALESVGAEHFSVHVHTDEPGRAVSAGIARGVVSDIRIACFVLDALRAGSDQAPARPATRRRAIVVVASGAGAVQLCQQAGARVVGGDRAVTSAMVAQAVIDADAAHTVVMVNGVLGSEDVVNISAQAHAAGRAAVIVPTLSMVQCLSALSVHDEAADAHADTYAMAQAAAATRRGCIMIADEAALTLAGTCERGDVLGLIGIDVLVIANDQVHAAIALIDLMLSTGGELVTVLLGSAADDGLADAVAAHIAANAVGVEFVAYDGGQDGDVIQVGVE